MKHKHHIQEAATIGKDSYWLMHFEQLPPGASLRRQVDALKADKRWQEQHLGEVTGQINRLIKDIEETTL